MKVGSSSTVLPLDITAMTRSTLRGSKCLSRAGALWKNMPLNCFLARNGAEQHCPQMLRGSQREEWVVPHLKLHPWRAPPHERDRMLLRTSDLYAAE